MTDRPAPTPLRLVLAGADGRMGQLCVEGLRGLSDFVLAGRLVRGSDVGTVLSEARPAVLLDFTRADASPGLAKAALERGISPVIGTSGLGEAEVGQLAEACQRAQVGGLLVPNFSLGAVLQMRFAAQASRYLACTAIRERHHLGKRDQPSGTALATARRVAEAGGCAAPPIQSERLQHVVAEQDVLFASLGERLELQHAVSDRRAYWPGIVLALRRVRGLRGLVVGLDALLD
ncbi:MAG: 4-hydroxy-tetrahydrodipicolinate reductase [Planctomycetota bacterium]